ncbi:uncharacterized protein RSE6_07789 [Rhynchosporium secalis]|uniref:Uncharacterized protein n=1 Tax=Rhynchosporium secalis TaxID=38038 RepID=A0A1E1MDR3_RHYSE|nr:uncharacterized protein RSE6_07789 [Rhynchosporium secalis]
MPDKTDAINLNVQNSGQQIIPKNMPISYLFYKLKDGESRHKAIVSEALVSKDAVKSSQWKLKVKGSMSELTMPPRLLR